MKLSGGLDSEPLKSYGPPVGEKKAECDHPPPPPPPNPPPPPPKARLTAAPAAPGGTPEGRFAFIVPATLARLETVDPRPSQKGAFETVLRDALTADSLDPAGIYFGTAQR